MRPFFLKRYKHLKRFKEILQIISKEGLGYTFDHLGITKRLGQARHRKKPGKNHDLIPAASRIRAVLEQLGPAFIKLGQILSTRADLLPPSYLKELELLQDRVPPIDFKKIKKVIEEELNKPLDQVFSKINSVPLASASIGQVHKANLLNGEQVIIKVQKPGIANIIETDLEIIADVAQLLEEKTERGKFYKLRRFTEEFTKTLREELDYTFEAENAERLWKNFQGDNTISIPKVYREYSSQRVLVQEYKEGIKISEGFIREKPAFTKEKVAARLVQAICQQILSDGFFHADLHPGNIAVGEKDTIIFMDFGMMGRLDDQTKESLTNLLLDLMNKDIDGIILSLSEINCIPSDVNKSKLRRDLYSILDKYYHKQLFSIKLKVLLGEILSLAYTYQLIFPEELMLTTRTLILLESIVERLNPEISFIELMRPVTENLLSEKISPSRLWKTLSKQLSTLYRLTLRFPKRLELLLQKAEEGNFRLILEHSDFSKLIYRFTTVGNRLAFSLIVSSIIVGSSLIAQKTESVFLWRFHLAEMGFMIAVLMGLWLLVSIIRSGRI